jgi:alcohol dehydrogenase (cytochrome c)
MHHFQSRWIRGALALLACCTVANATEPGTGKPAPAFDAKQLTTLPTDGWITNGGTLWNQRYSPLTSINKTNVKDLKAKWRASLNGSGVKPRAGNQGQPLVYDGVVYVMTGDNDAFAIGVESGELLWEYKANVDPNAARPCCSWVGRGLGLGDGKVFLGRLDSKLEALDQRTGKLVWSVQAEDPRLGYAIASAPLYYNGLVITGFAGSDMGTRGRLKAFDAKTGKLRWTFYTVPGPGEFGHDTWPAGSDVWKYGGAAVWQTPAIDPELGLIYFSTANPGPVLNGAIRKGDNLFSVSIVAIEAKTGKYRWHFQQVHHDIWDYDSPNPVILFDAPYEGKMRRGVAQAAKTGWVYLLDRETGKPLLGMVETAVMQEPAQHTSPTQPFPIGDALVPQHIDIPPEGFELVNEGRIFTPFLEVPTLWKPLAAVNWPPSSYDPETNLMYICAADSFWGAQGGDPDYPVEPGALYSGSVVARIQGARRGVFAVIDVKTNRLAWRQQWPDQCYSGSIVTAGGLVFIGRNDGRLTALDKSNGKKLWEFQTDGGVNAPASTFEYKAKQYVVVHAGGTALGGSKRSDGVWLFSLDGTMASLPRGSADPAGQFPPRTGPLGPPAPQQPGAAPPPGTATPPGATLTGDAKQGKALYTEICGTCHGETGKGGLHGGAPFTANLTTQSIIDTVAKGRNQMPPFGSLYSPQQLQDLAAYVLELKPKE